MNTQSSTIFIDGQAWKLVPADPTEEMQAAGWIDKEDVSPKEIYWAMLAAAPAPPEPARPVAGEERLTEACKPWEFGVGDPPDYESPLTGVYSAGVTYAIEMLASLTNAGKYDGCDGSESFEGDVSGTIMNVLKAAKLYDDEDGTWAALRTPSPLSPEETGRSGDVAVDIQTMKLSDGRADYFVRIKCGDREVTPHVFRERFKAEYTADHFSWIFGLRPDKPDLMAYGETTHPNAAPSPHTAETEAGR